MGISLTWTTDETICVDGIRAYEANLVAITTSRVSTVVAGSRDVSFREILIEDPSRPNSDTYNFIIYIYSYIYIKLI